MNNHPVRVIAAAAALVLLAACGSKQDRIDTGLKKGAEFVRLGDWDKANIEIRNVLQIDPKSAQAYLLSAQVSEAQREVQRAFGAYSKAVELKPDLLEAKVGLARIYLVAGEPAKAESSAKDVLAADARNAGAQTIMAALLARDGKLAEAEQRAKAIIEAEKVAPVDTVMVLAGLYQNVGKSADALTVIDRALADHPTNLGLLQVGATIAGTAPAGHPMAARADGYYRVATKEAPKNNDLWRAWATHHLQRNDIDRAEAVLRDAVAAAPTEGRRREDLLAFLAQRRSFDVAEKAYLAAVAEHPREMPLRLGLVALYQGADRTSDAQKVLRDVAAQSDDTAVAISAKAQLAAYELAGGKRDAAQGLLAEVLKASPRENAALLLRGRMALQDNRAKDAIPDLRAVVRDQPANPEAVGLLARAHRAAGEAALAREVLAEAVKLRPADPELRLLLVADLVEAKDLRTAMSEVDEGLRAAPQALRLYEARARIALLQNDKAAAEKTFVTLKNQLPQQSVGYLRLGQLYTRDGRLDSALKEYDAAAKAAPGDAMPHVAAVGLLVGMKRWDEAHRRIEARRKDDPKNILHDQLLVDVAIAQGDLAGAERAARSITALAPQLEVGYLAMARVLGLRKDMAGAVAVLAEGEKAAPQQIALPLARAEWLMRARHHDDAIALYEQLLQRAPDNEAVANNLAYLLVENKGDRASLERALAVAQRFAQSPNPSYLDSLGWVHTKLGQYDKALPLLERAVALAPDAPIVNLHLGKALVKSGDAARGKPYLKKAVDSKADLPNLDEARALLAQG